MTLRLLALLVFTGALAACSPAHDGETLWRYTIKKSHIQRAAVDTQRLYLCADNVYCLEIATGRLLWDFKTFGTHTSAPVIADERLFFQCGGLYALEAATGAVAWEFWTNTWASVTPAVDDGRVYAPAGEHIYCLNAINGNRLWSLKTGLVESAPVAIGKKLFFSVADTVFCVESSTGLVLWRFDVGSDRVQLAQGGEGLLSVGFEGRVRAHCLETGEVQWQLTTNMPRARFSGTGAGHVLVSAGVLYCLDPQSGVPIWTFSGDQASVRAAHVSGRHVFLRVAQNELLCISMHDGSFVRRLRLPHGGRLLKNDAGAVFFPGGSSRTVSCVSLSVL